MNIVADSVVNSTESAGSVNISLKALDKTFSKDDLQIMLDSVGDKLKEGSICVMAHEEDGNTALLAAVSKDLHKTLRAGDLVKEVSAMHGGRGGGRPDKARAGIKGSGIVDALLSDAKKFVAEKFS